MPELPRRPYLNSATCGCGCVSDGTTMTVYPCEGHRTAGTGVSIRAAAGHDHLTGQNGYRYYRKLYEATGDLANLDRMREYVTVPGGMDVAAAAWEGLAALFAEPSVAQQGRPGAPVPLCYLYALLVVGVAALVLNVVLPVPSLWPHLLLTAISGLFGAAFGMLLTVRRRWKDSTDA